MNLLVLGVAGLTAAATFFSIPCLLRLADQSHTSTRERLYARMTTLGMSTDWLNGWLRLWRLGAIGLPLVFGLIGLLPLGLMIGFLCHRLVPHYLDWRIARHEALLESQASMVAHQMAGQLRAGTSLVEAVDAAGRQVPKPVRWHMEKLGRQVAQGAEMSAALESMRGSLRLEGMTVLVVALKVALERGGPLADILERITHSLQEMDRLRRKRDTDTASGRMVITTLAVFPFGFMLLAYLMDPNVKHVMFTFYGQMILVVTGLITYFSVLWANHILKMEE